MKTLLTRTIAASALAASLATPAMAHRQWLMPSATTFSNDDMWLAVDAAVSNDLFYFEHRPLQIAHVKAWAPDGSEAKIENAATAHYRSTFDVHLTQRGTWKIGSFSEMLMGSYDLNGRRMHSYNRIVIPTTAPPANQRYLVQFTVTGYAEKAAEEAPDIEAVIAGFDVKVPPK